MKFTIDQSLEHGEPEIVIRCSTIDSRLAKLIEDIRLYSFSLTGIKNGGRYQIALEDICYFEVVDETTFLYTEREVYSCEYRLYELEEKLAGTVFVRISKSCILNSEKLKSVRTLMNGRLEATLKNEEKQVVSRHYVEGLKEKFGIYSKGGKRR